MTDISKMPFGKQINFGQANINIAALSDTHGQIDKTAAICDTYENIKKKFTRMVKIKVILTF